MSPAQEETTQASTIAKAKRKASVAPAAGGVPSYFIVVATFCWAARPSPRNRRGSVLSYFNIVVTFLIIYLSKSYLPPACAAIFGAGRRRSPWGGGGGGEGAPPRDRRRSVPPYFIVVVLFICLFFHSHRAFRARASATVAKKSLRRRSGQPARAEAGEFGVAGEIGAVVKLTGAREFAVAGKIAVAR